MTQARPLRVSVGGTQSHGATRGGGRLAALASCEDCYQHHLNDCEERERKKLRTHFDGEERDAADSRTRLGKGSS